MPVSPDMAEDLSAGVRDLYADAEARLLGIIARQLAAGMEAPGWAVNKLHDISALRRAAQAVVAELGKATTLDVFDAVAEEYNRGWQAGLLELGALHPHDSARIRQSSPLTLAVDLLGHESVELVSQTYRGILRGVEDVYRQVIASVSATPLLGIGTRRQATQQALARFADRGVVSFTDKAGCNWSMTSYAEMAVRTSTGWAAVEAHDDYVRAGGVNLVIVSDARTNAPCAARGKAVCWPRTVRPDRGLCRSSTPPVTVSRCLCASPAASARPAPLDYCTPTAVTR